MCINAVGTVLPSLFTTLWIILKTKTDIGYFQVLTSTPPYVLQPFLLLHSPSFFFSLVISVSFPLCHRPFGL